MPRLIVDDAGQKKAFRVSKGRLSIGSDDSAKLRLTADGVEAQHATLIVRPDGVDVQVAAPVTIDGKTVESGETALAFGATLAVGGATITVEADEVAAKPIPAKPIPAKPAGSARSKAGAAGKPTPATAKGGGARQPARAGRSGEGAGARRSGVGDRRRAGDRGVEKKGLPAWIPFVGVAVALTLGVWFFSGFTSGGKAEANMTAAFEHLANGKLDLAANALDRVDGSELSGAKKTRYEELVDELAGRRAFRAGASARMRAMREVDEQLKGLVDRQFKSEEPEPAKVRLLWDRIADWRESWPMHGEAIWLEDPNWAADMAWIAEMEAKFGDVVAKDAPYDRGDAEFRVMYFVDEPKLKRYNLAVPVVEAAARNATDETDREVLTALLARLREEQRLYAQERFDKARAEFEAGADQQAAAVLVLDVRTLTEPDLIDRAANLLIGFPRIALILGGYRESKPEIFEELMQNATIASFVHTNLPELLEDEPQG